MSFATGHGHLLFASFVFTERGYHFTFFYLRWHLSLITKLPIMMRPNKRFCLL
jgi:hypothetical protein